MPGVRDHTELDVWKLCDDLRCRVRDVVDRPGFARHRKLRDQLEEAAESPCPNIGEGFSRYFPRDNARFVRVAAGSLTEVLEHLDRALARRLITLVEWDELRPLARRARGAATKYIVYLQSATAPHTNGRKRSKDGNE